MLKCQNLSLSRLTLRRYGDLLRSGRYADRITASARFCASLQTGPGAYKASYKMGTGYFQGVALTIHPI